MEPTEHNRRAWDEIHRRRAEAMAERLGVPDDIRRLLPPLAGRHVLHLQCATGESTADLVELGALATGVDISTEALEVAREQAPGAVFVLGDVHALPVELRRGRFDLVYTGGGVVNWIHDLGAWTQGIAAALRPGGAVLLYDDHPVARHVDELGHWRGDYFSEEVDVGVGWHHFDLPGEPAREETHEHPWRLGQLVTAFVEAGLAVERLDELPAYDRWRGHPTGVPGVFVLQARKG
jgi:SAM-dependent methyltransferase